MCKKLVVLIAATFIVGGIASYAGAFGEAIPTKVGIQKTDKLWKLVAKAPKEAPFPLPDCGSPEFLPGGSLTVVKDGGLLECDLSGYPHELKLLGKCEPGKHKGYKYKADLYNTTNPCTIIILKGKVLKVLAKGDGALPAPAPPLGNGITEIDLRFNTLGTTDDADRYCAEWGGDGYSTEIDGTLLKEEDAPAPATCLSPVCTENGDDPQCEYPTDPCTDGTCAISGNVCGTYADCDPDGLEQCCCHGICL